MKILLYCTKNKWRLFFDRVKQVFTLGKIKSNNDLNGKIVGECDFEVEEIGLVEIPDYAGDECHTFVYDVSIYFETKTLNQDKLFKKSCLNWEEMEKYLYSTNGKGYAIHIKNLTIFDKSRELSEFDQVNNCCFEKEVNKDWEGLPIYACVFTNCCKYKSDSYTCDKHFYPLKHIHNMSKVFDTRDCKWKYIISLSPQEMCRIANKEQDILVRKKVLKGMLK